MERPSHAFHQEFAAPFSASDRTFDADYLLFASRGAFALEIGARRWLLPPQRAALIPANTGFSVTTSGPTVCSSVLFRNGELSAFPARCRIFAMSELARRMTEHAMRWGSSRATGDKAANCFFQALACVAGELAEQEQETWLPKATSPALRRATQHVLDHLDTEVGFEILAAKAGLSERTLARRFKSELEMNWADYRRRARMIRAMELLSAGAGSVTAVGLACGFESTTAFIRAFTGFAGMTPRKYRLSGGR